MGGIPLAVTSAILFFLCLPSLASCQSARGRSRRRRIPPPVQKWAEPLRQYVPHAVHSVLASELTIYLSKQAENLSPALLARGVPAELLQVALRMPSTSVIVGVNVVVFCVWHIAALFPAGPLLSVMKNHFILSGWEQIRRARPHSFLTAGFSHVNEQHLAGNLGALLVFGGQPEQWLGRRTFVYMYISSIYASDFLSLSAFRGKTAGHDGSLGASGAISALQAYFCLRFPDARFRILGRYWAAPWACVIWYLQELFSLGKDTGIGHGAHLGGYTFGVLFFLLHDIVLAPRGQRERALQRLARVFSKNVQGVGERSL